jgi:hypothetical protein
VALAKLSEAPSGPRPPEAGAKRARRALNWGILLSAAAFTGAGLWLSVVNPLVVRESTRYADAPTCARVADALTTHDCVVLVPGTVDSAMVTTATQGALRPLLTIDCPPLRLHLLSVEIPRPSRAFYHLQPGQPLSLKLWHGRITGVYVTAGDALRTDASPYIQDSLDLSLGLFALGVGLALILIHPPRALARRLAQRTRWHRELDVPASGRGSLGRMLRDRPLRLGLLGLLLLQVLDIVTSIRDSSHGLFEANPLAVRLIDAYGPFAGLSGIKVPATIAFFLALTRLPRRIAIVVTYAGVAVMVYIVAQNVALGSVAGAA